MKVADDKLNKLTVIFVTEQLFAFVFQRSVSYLLYNNFLCKNSFQENRMYVRMNVVVGSMKIENIARNRRISWKSSNI